MKNSETTLTALKPGGKGWVSGLSCQGLLRRRLIDLGFVPGAEVEVMPEASDKDPRIYRIKSTALAIRNSDAAAILISREPAGQEPARGCFRNDSSLGIRPDEQHMDEITVALAGNPNAGKSTLFNALTGLNQHVGNWPGKTVSRAEGWWTFSDTRFKLVDLPGTYSLLSTSVEEEVARDYLLFGHPECTVIVADATRLERHLNLAIQILQITSRAVLCVNMIDEAEREGIEVDSETLSERLGIPVVLTAANRKRGLRALQEEIHRIAVEQVKTNPLQIPMPEEIDDAVGELDVELKKVFPGLQNTRWIAMRLIDGSDERIRQEVAKGLLADESGRIGDSSLLGASPTQREIKR